MTAPFPGRGRRAKPPIPGLPDGNPAQPSLPGRQANPRMGILPNGKTPGGPKGLPPGLGGAARGGGNRQATVAGLRKRLKTKLPPAGS